jgi:cytosine/adenosine deaminase-related metal-dependent hydrolase
MESTARRTLVKSPPELWELADDLARMEAWMAGVLGSAQPVPVEVTDREPERILAWRATEAAGERARIAIELADGGFGTAVRITAQYSRTDIDAALEQVLDELGGAERRPFSGR